MKITKVPYGVPKNETVRIKFDEINNRLPSHEKPVNLKFILSMTESERKSFNEKEFIEKIQAADSNAVSVKVNYDIQRDLHIRSKEIVNKTTMADKFSEYCTVEKIDCNEELLAKVKELEDEQNITYFTPRHSFTLLKAKVRGAVGIKKMSGRDEVEIDFNSQPDGIIALCGENGRGKTTFIENCQPYPRMLTRSGTLQDHFFLKDSLRELLYIDEEGTYYNIRILIDGKNKSGSCKYFVYTGKDKDNLKAVSSVNGNVKPYNEWLEQNFGPISLYLRTAFYAKEQTPDVPDIVHCTKGDKKNLFCSLIGISSLKDISVAAKKRADVIGDDIDRIRPEVEDTHFDAEIEGLEKRIKLLNESTVTTKDSISVISGEIDRTKESLNELDDSKVQSLKDELKDYKKKFTARSEDRKTVDSYDEIKEDLEQFSKLKENHRLACEDYDSYTKFAYEPAAEQYETLNSQKAEYKSEIMKLESKRDALCENGVFTVDENCPTCGARLSEDKLKGIREKVNANIKKRNDLTSEINTVTSELNTVEDAINDLDFNSISLKMMEKKNAVAILQSEMNEYNEASLLSRKAKYEAVSDPDMIDVDLDSFNNEINRLEDEISKFDNIEDEIKELSDKVTELLKNKGELEDSLSHSMVEIGKATAELEAMKKAKTENEELGNKLVELEHQFNDWMMIYKAFGANGIQALELEAFAPDIADITNRILESAYGDRFKVSFKTLREGSDGHLIEDFDIIVDDLTYGTSETLEWLSSGEAVWIRAALYNAFSIVRMRNSGMSIKVIFADEVDGSLSSTQRLNYLKMIKTAHIECGAVQTVMITHSVELKDAIENRIDF